MFEHNGVPTSPSRRALTICGLATVALPFSMASSQTSAQGQVVDRVSGLLMLTQRMSKAYCQLGLGILSNDAETILARSLTRFNGAFVQVRENKVSDRATVSRVENDWAQFRDLLSSSPAKASYPRIEALGETLLSDIEVLKAQLVTSLGVQSAQLTALCGRQRFLAQRMAKCAFALMWGLDAKTFGEQHAKAHDQFAAGLAELKRSPRHSPAIDRDLDMATTQFELFDVALGSRAEMAKMSAVRAANVAKTNERLLEIFDDLTALYANAPS